MSEVTEGPREDGQLVGRRSVVYMAPGASGRRETRRRPKRDWYAVGTMLYLALTGKLPFRGNIARGPGGEDDDRELPAPALVAPGRPERT